MQLRTITVGAHEDHIVAAGRAAQVAQARLETAGYVVQSRRLALTQATNECGDLVAVARGVEERAIDQGFDFVSLGPVDASRLPMIHEALGATQTVFASALIATPDGVVLPEALWAAAEAMVALATISPDGFGNLRFAALACVGAGSPFLPAAYHDRGEPWLAIGVEGATLAGAMLQEPAASSQESEILVDAHVIQPSHGSVPSARTGGTRDIEVTARLAALTQAIEHHAAAIAAALAGIAGETGIRFTGCDWSFAPRPGAATSIGAAIEAISGVPFGAWGTLAAVRRLTAAVQAAQVTRLGFSGVMLPVLEDTVLAQRNVEGRYSLRDLLAFSAVCGTGLDTIPLPGDATAAQLAAVLSEVAALATTYRKPLTARLMPMPGLRVGDLTRFDFSENPDMARYFCPARVMAL